MHKKLQLSRLAMFLLALVLQHNARAIVVACTDLGDKVGGVEQTVYPVSTKTMQCISWKEFNTFDRDPNGNPDKNPRDNWKKLNENTARAINCRNSSKEGLNKKEVGCECPTEPLQPPGGESQRIWDDMKKAIEDEKTKQDALTPEKRKEHCKDWHYWYHKDPAKSPSGYMTEDLIKKTKDRHKNTPTDGRHIPAIKENTTGTDWDIYFPADQDVPGKRFQ
jgi:hypothetical protein